MPPSHPAAPRSRPDLLLINAPLSGGGLPGGVYPPLATLALGSFLQHQGATVQLLDPSVDLDLAALPAGPAAAGALLDELVRQIAARSPRLLGLSAMGVIEGRFAVALARRVRARLPQLPIVVGGSWASGAARTVLQRFPWLDAVAPAAAEHALRSLLAGPGPADRTTGGAAARAAWFAAHPGFVVADPRGGPPLDTGPAPLLRAPESRPLVLPLLAHPARYDTAVYVSSRGCPFHCAFCSDTQMFPGRLDEPLDKVAADLQALAGGLRSSYLWLSDPLFGASPRRLGALLPLLAAHGTRFLFESRVDILRPADLPAIRAAGGDLVYLGLEAVSDRALLAIRKVTSAAAAARYRERARALIVACAESDVVPVLGLLQPVPGDGPADLAEALAFVEELEQLALAAAPRTGSAIRPFFHVFPYRVDPGTPAWRELVDAPAAAGQAPPVALSGDAADPLQERVVREASAALDPAAVDDFRQRLLARQRAVPPAILRRVLRSVPRGYLANDWS